MTPELPVLYIARFVLQADTAFALCTGLADGAFDNAILRDVNHLPAISGTALAGVLRHRFSAEQVDSACVNDVFGFADKQHENDAASRLHVSWGMIHNRQNLPVEGRLSHESIEQDPLLKALSQDHLIHRARVALNKRGIARDKMKFDITLAPAGCRFSFEMRLWSDREDDPNWKNVLAILCSPLQLGSASHSGLGHFTLTQLHCGCFDLRIQAQYAAFRTCSQTSLHKTDMLHAEPLDIPHQNDIYLELEAEDFWRFGQTGAPLKTSDRAPDAVPLSEPMIEWGKNGVYDFDKRWIVIPGSAVKGALAHRVEFHYRRLTQNFATQINTAYDKTDETRDKSHPIAPFLGYAANTQQEESLGQAGLLFFQDVYLAYEPQDLAHLMHTSIDRFTGGVRDGVLFAEEMLWKKSIQLTINVDWPRLKQVQAADKRPDSNFCTALALTLEDLYEGRLALGAGASKGHGYFQGTQLRYSEKMQHWMEGR